MKKIIRLTEQDLHRIVKESIKRVLKETSVYPSYDSTTSYDVNQGVNNQTNGGQRGFRFANKLGDPNRVFAPNKKMTTGPRDMGPSLDEIVRSLFGEGRGSVDIENYNGSDATVFRLNGVNRINNYEQLAKLDKIMASKRCFLETSKYTDTQLILIYVRE